MSGSPQQMEVWALGRVAYDDAWALQDQLVEERGRDAAPDRLLLLEHPPTYTLGSSGHEEYVLMPEAERARRGVRVVHVDRGGDVTYHGPGQLVGYPIMRLPRRGTGGLRADVVGYVRGLERTIMLTLADYGIRSRTIPGLVGVWVDTPAGEEKICAIGVKVNVRGVTKHGFALNINTDLSYFEGIVPCGIHDKGVTSMAQLLGGPLAMDAVAGRLAGHFGAVFGLEMVHVKKT